MYFIVFQFNCVAKPYCSTFVPQTVSRFFIFIKNKHELPDGELLVRIVLRD